MELFKALTEKKFAEIKDHCENVIAEKVSEKIYEAKTSYLNTLRGIDENTEIIIKSDDGDKKKSKKDDDSDDKGSEDDDKEDGEKKKKTFPFAKKADDSKNESKGEDLEVDDKDVPKKDKKKVTTKDAGKFADADS